MANKSSEDNEISELTKRFQGMSLRCSELSRALTQERQKTKELCIEIAYVRNNLTKTWLEILVYKILKTLIGKTWLFSRRRRERFLNSAIKRDPSRSLSNLTIDGIGEEIPLSTFSMNSIQGFCSYDSSKKNIIVVTHEASQTGAPILVYNIAYQLCGEYNITVVCLRGGVMVEAYKEVCCNVEVLNERPNKGEVSGRYIKQLLKKMPYEFAVVNSVEARYILPFLKKERIASVALLHEFASSILPQSAFHDVTETADQIVFSSEVTLENAMECVGFNLTPQVHVFPQGQTIVPRLNKLVVFDEIERAKLRAMMRPDNSESSFVVIGVGSVCLRKGVDLFIESARVALSLPGGENMRFFWIGAGYKPEQDTNYSIFLKDQIKRSGLEDYVKIIDHTTEILYAYELADAFLLSSRLDPLPNVAIDALMMGMPTLCFDKTSGFAPLFFQWGLGEDCVARYMDASDLGEKLVRLAASPKLIANVSAKSLEVSKEIFDMKKYAKKISCLGHLAARRLCNINKDQGILLEATSSYPNRMGNVSLVEQRDIEKYLTDDAQKMSPYRPEPGFNPLKYGFARAKEIGEPLTNDAYADYLQNGRPEGTWKSRIIYGPICKPEQPSVLKSALHIHAFYTDELSRILQHLSANTASPSLYISVNDTVGARAALEVTRDYGNEVSIEVFPNLGRDIGPLLTGFGRQLVENYDVIGHVHTKKSMALQNDKLVASWTKFLFENVLGGAKGGAMLDGILHEFEVNPNAGIVFPSDTHVIGWNRNFANAKILGERLGLSELPEAFDFPVGTMFWARAEVLRYFVDLNLKWTDYPSEPIDIDGTMLHALERLLGVIPQVKGFDLVVTDVKGVIRNY